MSDHPVLAPGRPVADMSAPEVPGFEGFSQIGRGGFSRVYRARQLKLGREVAIKVLNFGLTDDADRSSFERETTLMGRVSAHPNIVTVYDTAFTTTGQPCIVMELYSAGSIAELVDASGGLSPAVAIDVGVAIASALDTSHKAGVLHCDLKPQNILVSDFGQAALGDFGISTFTEERTRTGSGAGFTLHYAAPEIVEGASPTPSSDVYSLAATLYTALAARRPFSAPEKQAPAELARRVLLEEPAPLTSVGVPSELSDVILAAMAKEPSSRPASAAEFAQQLYEAGTTLGYNTGPPSIVQRPPLPTIRIHDHEPFDADTATGPAPDNFRVAPPEPAPASSPVAVPVTPAVKSERVEPASKPGAAAPAPVDRRDAIEAGDTVHRDDINLAPTPEPIGVEVDSGPPTSRRLIGAALGVVAMIAVAGLAWFMTRGSDAPQQTPIPSDVLAADPVRAPATPTNVRLERVGVSAVRVLWDSDEADAVFEVHRTDVDSEPVTVSENEAVLSGVAAGEVPCVNVLAIRANRSAAPTATTCLPVTAGPQVQLRPDECQKPDCTVRLVLDGFAANSTVNIAVLDPEGANISGYGAEYEASADTDAQGRIDQWRLTLPELLPSGRYMVIVADDVGETFSNVVTVTETP